MCVWHVCVRYCGHRYDNVQSQRQRLDAEIQKRMAILDAIKEIESERADVEGGVDVDKATALLKKIDYFNKWVSCVW